MKNRKNNVYISTTRGNTGHAVLQSTPKPPKRRIYGPTDRRTDEPTAGRTDRQMDGRTDGQTDTLIEVLHST